MPDKKPAVHAGTPMSDLVLSQLRGLQLVGPGILSERRLVVDRRKFTLWSVLYGGVRPRRRAGRRTVDVALPVLDWHESHLLAVAIGILLLSFADAFLTLRLLLLGASEVNPFMATLIYKDVTVFTAVKMGLTGVGVLMLVLLSHYRLFGRIRVVKGLYAILIGYIALVLYELSLVAVLT